MCPRKRSSSTPSKCWTEIRVEVARVINRKPLAEEDSASGFIHIRAVARTKGFRSRGSGQAAEILIKLFSPENEVQLALAKSLLEAEGIPFFVHNDHFGSLYVGIQIEFLNRKTIMVDEAYAPRARKVLAEFLDNTRPEPGPAAGKYSLWDKLRMIAEGLLFGWLVPGKRRRWKKEEK